MVTLPGLGWSQSMPLAEAILTNQASATFQVEETGEVLSVLSNKVEIRIEPVEALVLLDDQVRLQRAGRWVYFDHTLYNAGNVTTEFTVTFENDESSEYQFQELSVQLEESASKLPADLITTQQAEVSGSIDPGGQFFIRAQAFVPIEVERYDVGRLNLVVQTKIQALRIANRDSVLIQAGTILEIEKVTMTPDAVQNDELIYQINGRNTGDAAALAIPHLVDGRPARNVIVRDRIPANTTFQRFIASGLYQPLYHYFGTALHDYRTRPPSNPEDIDAVAWSIPIMDVGSTFSLTFGVTIAENANGQIFNTADVYYNDGLEEEVKASASNQVVQNLPAKNAKIAYFTDDEFARTTRMAKVGFPLFVQASAAACNFNAAWADTAQITIRSAVTGDVEMFESYETSRNSGVFRILPEVSTRDYQLFVAIAGNTILEISKDDELIAELGQCGTAGSTRVQAAVLVDPKAIVFDSESNRPIPGVRVQLIDVTGEGNGGNAGGLARVFASDEITEVSAEQVTKEDGSFELPLVNISTYRIELETPQGYNYPSVLTKNQLPGNRVIEENASYGREFRIDEDRTPIAFDVPLDVNGLFALKIEKTANRDIVEVGDQVVYTIKVTNQIFSTITGVLVDDKIPFGFSYVKGSARLDSVKLADPSFKSDSLRFQIGDIEPGQTKLLIYRLRVGPLALNGDGENIAFAWAPELIKKISALATVKVQVTGGIIGEESYMVGKVYFDENQNRMQDRAEPGIPGVKLYLENGNFVITDAYGRYTFFGVPARKHVLKLDVESLPKGAKLELLDQRHANDASSRFVDLKRSEMHKADFAVCACEGEIDGEIKRRFDAMMAFDNEWSTGVTQRMEVGTQPAQRDQRMLPTQGFVGNGREVRFDPLTKADGADLGKGTLPVSPAAAALAPIEDILVNLNNRLGFVDYLSGDTLSMTQATIRVKGRANSDFVLYVNDEEILDDRVGKRASTDAVEAWEFIGVKFRSGANDAKVVVVDPFGNRRDSVSITLIAPGAVAKLQVKPEEDGIPADGASTVAVIVTPVDEDGVPIKTRVPVTLDVSAGEWKTKDLDPSQPGTQVFITNGEGRFMLRAPMDPADVTVRATSGANKGEALISFVPDLREMIAAGIIEGTIRLSDRTVIQGIELNDGFEREIRELSTRSGTLTADARAAFFLKGKIKGNYLLTAGYDSERDKEGMFRDIQPDQFYPVYGEASVKGFEAQSSGRLFVKVEHNKSYALYGDFQTTDQHPAQQLGVFNRNLTGAKWHYETRRVRTNAWVTQTSWNQVFEEIPALGISGPYTLKQKDVVLNSERVEIITRDRNQPDVIIRVEQMTRFTDYAIEPFTGALFFKAPVRSVDDELNPRSIRIIYEVQTAAARYWVAGGDIQFKLTKGFEVGATVTEDMNPSDAYSLRSANATLRLGTGTVIAEMAQSERESKGTGTAGRVEYKFAGKRGDGRIFAGKSSQAFENTFATIGAGRTEGGMRGTLNLGANNMIQAEALYSRNDTTRSVRSGGSLRYQRNVGKYVQVEFGARYMEQDSLQTSTLRTKLLARLPGVNGAQAYGEFEQALAETDRRIAAMGGEYQLGSRGRIYARHEFLSSIRGPYALNDAERQNNTMIGLDASYMKNGQVFSEYRIREGFDGRQAQAAMGVRNKFQLQEGFGLTTSLERVFSVSGKAVNEGTAIAIGLDYTRAANWKASGQQEFRFSPRGDLFLNTLSYGRKISNDWTFLGKNIFAINDDQGPGRRVQERLRLGLAYRDAETSRWNSLMRYEIKYEDQLLNNLESNRLVHIVSTHNNWQASERLVISGTFAAKNALEQYDDIRTRNIMELAALRAILDIGKRWDAGVHASVLANNDLTMYKAGLGAELGFVVATNLRLAGGYNLFGYRDRDLTEMEYTDPGVYLGFAYKFDERAIQKLLRQKPEHKDVYDPCPPVGTACGEPEVAGLDFPVFVPDSLPVAPVYALPLNDMKFNLPSSIHFALNQSTISIASAHMLDRIADYMIANKEQKLTITGHTDSRNTFDYNLKLSMRRSDAAKAYLIASGIAPDRISTEAKSKNELAIAEQSIVNEAENRRVEFTLSPERPNVSMVKQVEDIQNKVEEMQNADEWGFLMYTSHSAVPDRVNFEDESNRLSQYIQIALDRVVLVMDHDSSLRLKLVAYQNNNDEEELAKARLQEILKFMEENATDLSRVSIEMLPYSTSAMTPEALVSLRRSIYFEFATPNNLVRMFQKMDVIGKGADNVPKAVTRVVELQKNRADYAILGESNPGHFLPDAVHFDPNSDRVDTKTHAVISRVASYMIANRNVMVELSGMIDSDTPIGQAQSQIRNRAEMVRMLLNGMGIDASRVTINDEVKLSTTVETSEIEKARNRRINFNYSGSDAIEVIKQEFDLKYKGAAQVPAQPVFTPRSPQ